MVPGDAESEPEPVQEGKAEEQDSKIRFTVAGVFRTVVEAQMAKAALDEAGISHLEGDFLGDPYNSFFMTTQLGRGRIFVREQDAERAKEIIREALEPCPLQDEGEGNPKGDDEAEPEGE